MAALPAPQQRLVFTCPILASAVISGLHPNNFLKTGLLEETYLNNKQNSHFHDRCIYGMLMLGRRWYSLSQFIVLIFFFIGSDLSNYITIVYFFNSHFDQCVFVTKKVMLSDF